MSENNQEIPFQHLRTFVVPEGINLDWMSQLAKDLSMGRRPLAITHHGEGVVSILVNQVLITRSIRNGVETYSVGIQNIQQGVSVNTTVDTLCEIYDKFRDHSSEMLDNCLGEIREETSLEDLEYLTNSNKVFVARDPAGYIDGLARAVSHHEDGLTGKDPRDIDFPVIVHVTTSYNDGVAIHSFRLPKSGK